MNRAITQAPRLRRLPRELMKLRAAPERSAAWSALRRALGGDPDVASVDVSALVAPACEGEVESLAASLTPGLSEALGVHLERAVVVELSLVSAQARIAAALDASGIQRVALLKGSASAWSLYDHSGHRARRDVDLLVPSDRLRDVVETLRADGWRDNPSPGADMETCRAWAMALDLPVGTLEVDLHRRLVRDGRYRIDEAGILDRAVSGVTHLPVTSPEDLLLHSCVHAGVSGFHVPLKTWVDLDRLVRDPRLCASTVIDRARAWESTTVTWACLEVARRWLRSPVDARLMEALRPPRWQARALRWLLQGDGAHPLRRPISKHAAVGLTSGLLVDRAGVRARLFFSLAGRRLRRPPLATAKELS